MIHQISLIGKRPTNEDNHICKSKHNYDYYAIFDGHGGNTVSKFLSEIMSKYFLSKKIKYPLSKSNINKIYDHVHKKLISKHNEIAQVCGSTCLTLIKYDNNICIYNTGDSRAVICSNNLAIPLTKDHKPNWPEERERITKLGGEIYFDGYDYRIKDLSVSRAFGDLESVPFITYKPDIYHRKIKKNDKFIVMACDGLWDVLTNSDVVNYILDNIEISNNYPKDKRKNIAKNLAEYAIEKGSTDNITIIIIFL